MRIGYLDDEYDVLKGAMRSLKKYDMEIIAMKNIDDVTNITMLTDAIISNSLEISASEEDRFIYLYKVLSAYDYVDKMPDILVRNSTQDTLEDMLSTLKEFKQHLRKE